MSNNFMKNQALRFKDRESDIILKIITLINLKNFILFHRTAKADQGGRVI